EFGVRLHGTIQRPLQRPAPTRSRRSFGQRRLRDDARAASHPSYAQNERPNRRSQGREKSKNHTTLLEKNRLTASQTTCFERDTGAFRSRGASGRPGKRGGCPSLGSFVDRSQVLKFGEAQNKGWKLNDRVLKVKRRAGSGHHEEISPHGSRSGRR